MGLNIAAFAATASTVLGQYGVVVRFERRALATVDPVAEALGALPAAPVQQWVTRGTLETVEFAGTRAPNVAQRTYKLTVAVDPSGRYVPDQHDRAQVGTLVLSIARVDTLRPDGRTAVLHVCEAHQ